MEILITALVVSTLNVVCFFVGAKIGQTVNKGEALQTPTLNPLQLYREHQEKKEADKEQEKINTIMENIERYDGTSNGQKDVPQ